MDTTNQRTETQDQIVIRDVKDHLRTWMVKPLPLFTSRLVIDFTNRLIEILNLPEEKIMKNFLHVS